MTSCINGHPMADDDAFCGRCGAAVEADLPVTEPAWATAAPTEADATRACPSGHPNPPENAFCATCGYEIATPASSPTRTVQSHPLRGVAAAAVVMLVVVGVILMLTRTTNDSPAPIEDVAMEGTTNTTISRTNLCQVQMLAWVDYTTQPGNSIMDVAAEFGIQSPEWVIANEAWETFQSNRLQVGRDQATQDAIDLIETGCTNLGDRFVPGRLPPE